MRYFHGNATYKFGAFELLPQQRRFLVDGKDQLLGARAFDLLLALVENADRVMSKQELLDHVWTDLCVEENNLHVQISALRRVLGGATIATVPGRGYRFVAALETGANTAVGGSEYVADAPIAPEGSAASKSMVPSNLSQLVGRDSERRMLADLLREHRLVSVVGAGGIGKTHLVQAVAPDVFAAFANGVVWIELAPLADADIVPALIASAFGITLVAGVAPILSLGSALRAFNALVVLDNAEHLAHDLADMAQSLLTAAPDVHVCVTSQLRLGIPGEQVLRLGTLAVPAEGTSLGAALEFGSVALLCARIRARDHRFAPSESNLPVVVDICRKLDGIALALELVASRVPLLGLVGVRDRLAERFDMLTSSSAFVPERQRTLSAAFSWSYELLAEPARRLLRGLGVFVGSFEVGDLLAVTERESIQSDWDVINLLEELVDRSLIELDLGDTAHFRLLESAREFALAKLRLANEERTVREAHLRYFCQRVQRACADYDSRDWQERKQWLLAYYANIRGALEWAFSIEGDAVHGAEMVCALNMFWYEIGQSGEHGKWLDVAATHAMRFPELLQARLLQGYGGKLFSEGKYAAAEDYFQRCLPKFTADGQAHPELGEVYGDLAILASSRKDYAQACLLNELSLQEMRRFKKIKGESIVLHNLACCYFNQEDFARATSIFSEAVDIARSLSNWHGLGLHLIYLAECMYELGDMHEAVKLAREALVHQRKHVKFNELAKVLLTSARIELGLGNLSCAASLLKEAFDVLKDTGHPLGYVQCLCVCVGLASKLGDFDAAIQLAGYCATWAKRNEIVLSPKRAAEVAKIIDNVRNGLDCRRLADSYTVGEVLPLEDAHTLCERIFVIAGAGGGGVLR